MSQVRAIHLGPFLKILEPKQLEHEDIARHLAEFKAKGNTIIRCKRGESGLDSPTGKQRGSMTVAERARESKRRLAALKKGELP